MWQKIFTIFVLDLNIILLKKNLKYYILHIIILKASTISKYNHNNNTIYFYTSFMQFKKSQLKLKNWIQIFVLIITLIRLNQ